MLDTFNGLPLHPLVVHAVVVLLPLSVVGAIVVALRPAWRQTYGWLVAGLLVVAATSSSGSRSPCWWCSWRCSSCTVGASCPRRRGAWPSSS
jgi:hypothetical protein